MSVEYKVSLNKGPSDGFSTMLKEAQDLFTQKHGVNIIGRDFEDILTTKSLFEEYINTLTEGMDATQVEQIESLAQSFQESTLQESLSGIQPYASLTMPIIVKLWARLSLKYAVPTEPVTQPAFTIAFMRPYIIDEQGNKHYIPEELNVANNNFAALRTLTTPIAVTGGKLTDYDLFTGMTGVSAAAGYEVDKKFAITSLKFSDAKTPADAVKCNIKVDLYRRLYGEVEYTKAGANTGDPDVVAKDIVFGRVDLEKGTLTLTSMNGTITEVGILGYLSSANHGKATNIDFDLDRKDIEIGTGEHIEASLGLEFLQDTKAMYQIDGAAELVDVMSNVCAQRLDMDIYSFLKASYVGTDAQYTKTFNVYPSSAYAINPSEWLNELKKLIDILATTMRNDYKCYNGYFVIIGNPINTMIIPNVTWTFNNVQDTQNGVDVQYSIGAVSGANRYTIVSSDLIPQSDGLLMFFVPTTDKFKTYTYYPYTFNVVNNYLNTRKPNVPSVMLTKRQTIEEFMPIIGKINILNNDGSVYNVDPISAP